MLALWVAAGLTISTDGLPGSKAGGVDRVVAPDAHDATPNTASEPHFPLNCGHACQQKRVKQSKLLVDVVGDALKKQGASETAPARKKRPNPGAPQAKHKAPAAATGAAAATAPKAQKAQKVHKAPKPSKAPNAAKASKPQNAPNAPQPAPKAAKASKPLKHVDTPIPSKGPKAPNVVPKKATALASLPSVSQVAHVFGQHTSSTAISAVHGSSELHQSQDTAPKPKPHVVVNGKEQKLYLKSGEQTPLLSFPTSSGPLSLIGSTTGREVDERFSSFDLVTKSGSKRVVRIEIAKSHSADSPTKTLLVKVDGEPLPHSGLQASRRAANVAVMARSLPERMLGTNPVEEVTIWSPEFELTVTSDKQAEGTHLNLKMDSLPTGASGLLAEVSGLQPLSPQAQVALISPDRWEARRATLQAGSKTAQAQKAMRDAETKLAEARKAARRAEAKEAEAKQAESRKQAHMGGGADAKGQGQKATSKSSAEEAGADGEDSAAADLRQKSSASSSECHTITADSNFSDEWCTANCNLGFCPLDVCSSGCVQSSAKSKTRLKEQASSASATTNQEEESLRPLLRRSWHSPPDTQEDDSQETLPQKAQKKGQKEQTKAEKKAEKKAGRADRQKAKAERLEVQQDKPAMEKTGKQDGPPPAQQPVDPKWTPGVTEAEIQKANLDLEAEQNATLNAFKEMAARQKEAAARRGATPAHEKVATNANSSNDFTDKASAMWEEAQKAVPGCKAIAPGSAISNEWCMNNCALGNCPTSLCSPECVREPMSRERLTAPITTSAPAPKHSENTTDAPQQSSEDNVNAADHQRFEKARKLLEGPLRSSEMPDSPMESEGNISDADADDAEDSKKGHKKRMDVRKTGQGEGGRKNAAGRDEEDFNSDADEYVADWMKVEAAKQAALSLKRSIPLQPSPAPSPDPRQLYYSSSLQPGGHIPLTPSPAPYHAFRTGSLDASDARGIADRAAAAAAAAARASVERELVATGMIQKAKMEAHGTAYALKRAPTPAGLVQPSPAPIQPSPEPLQPSPTPSPAPLQPSPSPLKPSPAPLQAAANGTKLEVGDAGEAKTNPEGEDAGEVSTKQEGEGAGELKTKLDGGDAGEVKTDQLKPLEETSVSQWDEAKKAVPGCHSIAPAGSITDEWCINNCVVGNCPTNMCSSECHLDADASKQKPVNSTDAGIENVRRLLKAKEAEAQEVRGLLKAKEAAARHEAGFSQEREGMFRDETALANETLEATQEEAGAQLPSPSPAPEAEKEPKKADDKNATVDTEQQALKEDATESLQPSPSPVQPSPVPLRPSPAPLQPSPMPAEAVRMNREARMAEAKRRWNKAAGIAEDGEPKKEVGCHTIAEGGNASDDWCKDNCAIGYCPAAMCSPECKLYGATTLLDAMQLKKPSRLVSPLAAQPGRKAGPKAAEI